MAKSNAYNAECILIRNLHCFDEIKYNKFVKLGHILVDLEKNFGKKPIV